MNYTPVYNPRPFGSERVVLNEPHTVGETATLVPGEGNYVWLQEVPREGATMVVTSPDGVTVYPQVTGAPAPGQVQVHYQDEWGGRIDFNAAQAGVAVHVDYDGMGSPLPAHVIAELQTHKADLDGTRPFTGRVGIGTPAASIAHLHVYDTDSTGFPLVRIGGDGTANQLAWNVRVTRSTGLLEFQEGSTGTTRLAMTQAGNMGMGGVAPEAWHANFRAIESPFGSLVFNVVAAQTLVHTNAYFDTAYRYKTATGAVRYLQNNAGHYFEGAPAGAAGAAITWVLGMSVLANGNVVVGGGTDAGFKLDVNGSFRATGTATFGSSLQLANNQSLQLLTSGAVARDALYMSGTNTMVLGHSGHAIQVNASGLALAGTLNVTGTTGLAGITTLTNLNNYIAFVPSGTRIGYLQQGADEVLLAMDGVNKIRFFAPSGGITLQGGVNVSETANAHLRVTAGGTTNLSRIIAADAGGDDGYIDYDHSARAYYIRPQGTTGLTVTPSESIATNLMTARAFRVYEGGVAGTPSITMQYHAGSATLELWAGFANANHPDIRVGGYTSEYMRIRSNGNVLIGTTSDIGRKLYVAGEIETTSNLLLGGGGALFANLVYQRNGDLGGGVRFAASVFPNADNTFYLGGTVAAGVVSADRRWVAVYAVNGTIQTSILESKENVEDVEPQLALRDLVDPTTRLIRFNYRGDKGWRDKDGAAQPHRHVGVDIDTIPRMYRTVEGGLNPMNLAAWALAAIRGEHAYSTGEFGRVDAELKALRTRVAQLEAQLALRPLN